MRTSRFSQASVKGSLEEGQISSITQAYELYFDPQAKTVVLFVAKNDADKVHELLQDLGFKELRVPERGGVPSELLRVIEQKEAEATKKIESLKAEVESMKVKYADFILASDEVLSIESQKAELPLRIATSANAFIIEGWTPTKIMIKLSVLLTVPLTARHISPQPRN